jgi:uncharacterized protein YbbK (DUF523 family)
MRILVSACLLGLFSRYDGRTLEHEGVLRIADHNVIFPVCPEQMGGLSTPRPRSEIVSGSGLDVLSGKSVILNENGEDVSAQFIDGAQAALKVARLVGATHAVFTECSPSCGIKFIKRKGERIPGPGVAAGLFAKSGIQVISSEDEVAIRRMIRE